MQSAFRAYSLGIVTENRAPGLGTLNEETGEYEGWINVNPTEQTPFIDGELRSNPETTQAKGVDADGQPYEDEVESDNCIPAVWLPLGSNRITPPDVRRGERVILWAVADSDTIYWTEFGDNHLRRLETVIYAWNANPNLEAKNGIDFKSCYYFEISGHGKHVTLCTSRANGEKAAFTFQFDGGEGRVTLQDDGDNHLFLDALERLWRLQNGDGTTLELDKRNFRVEAPDNIDCTAGKTVSFECTDYTVKAKTFTVDSPISTFQGNGKFTGDLGVGKDLNVTGGMKAGGNLACQEMRCTGNAYAKKFIEG